MSSLIKLAAVGAVVTMAVAAVSPAQAERLCLRFDNRSLIESGDEGEDAYDRVRSLGNHCFVNFPRLDMGVTILPAPKSDFLSADDFHFLSREQRHELGFQ